MWLPRTVKKRVVKLVSTCTNDAGCTSITATYALRIGKRTHKGTLVVGARASGAPATVQLRLPAKAFKALKKAGKRGGKLTLTVGTSKQKATLKATR